MSIQGYSYVQKARLDELDSKVEKCEEAVDTKTIADDYYDDMAILDGKDDIHFNKIDKLKNEKVVLADYDIKMDELSGKDNVRHTALNSLDTNYGMKASKAVFDNTTLELRALDKNHDMRLDELEKRFSTIQTDLYETVVQELDQKINSTEFEAMINQINVGQTGLAGDIAGLILTEEMLSGNAVQNELIATKADKAKFDTDVAGISGRHLDFEKRFLAIDQFFRLMAKTYKIYNKDTDVEQTYDANIKSNTSDRLFSFEGKRTNRLILKLTNRFVYNIFTNKISILNSMGNEIGFAVKSAFGEVSLSGDILITGSLTFPLKAQFLNLSGDVLYEDTLSDVQYGSLTNPSAVTISYGPGTKNFATGSTVSIISVTTGPIGSATISPPLPVWLSVNSTGVITNTSATSTLSQSYTVTVTSQDGSESATATVTINIVAPPNISYTVPADLKTGDAINIAPVNTGGTVKSSNGYSITEALPTGLTFNTTSGIFGGVGPAAGTYSFTVTATGIFGAISTTTVSLTIAPNATWVQRGDAIIGQNALDESGFSISLSADGNVVAIGAPFNDGTTGNANDNRGHVRVYDWNSSANSGAGAWQKRGNDIVGGTAGDQSGFSISLSADGNVVAICAPSNDGTAGNANDNRGHVRVYDWNSSANSGAGAWQKRGNDIVGEAAGDQSGWSVSLSTDGNVVAIGAPFNDGTTGNTNDNRGHVRVYDWNSSANSGAGAWQKRGNDIVGGAPGDQRGYSVDLNTDGNRLVVGARFADGTTGNASDNRGAAYIYEWNNNTWNNIGAIDGEAAGDNSGFSVSINGIGDIIAVSAINNDGTTGNASDNRGHVRIYKNIVSNGVSNWVQLGDDIDGEAAGDISGFSVGLSADGSVVAIGGFSNDRNTGNPNDNGGHVRVYKYNSYTDIDGEWVQVITDINAVAAGDGFGRSVGVIVNDQGKIIVAAGARFNDGTTGNSTDNRGHVRIFESSTNVNPPSVIS